MPAKPLTEEQLADAARLKEAFQAFQKAQRAAGRPASQDALSEYLGFKQSTLTQYLGGRIPLNPPTLAAFCKLMGAKPEDISPGITAQASADARAWLGLVEGDGSRGALHVADSGARPYGAAAIGLREAVNGLAHHLRRADPVARAACAPLLQQLANDPGDADSIAATIGAVIDTRRKPRVA